MANNCCVAPPAPTHLSGTVVEKPIIQGEVTFDTTSSKSVTETVITTTTNNSEVRETLVDVLTPTILQQELVKETIHTVAEELVMSKPVLSAVEALVVKNQEFINTIVSKITLDKEFIQGIADKVVDQLLDDDDTLAALKQCIISSINRCDGTPMAVGDKVATCDELAAFAAGVKDDVRRALK